MHSKCQCWPLWDSPSITIDLFSNTHTNKLDASLKSCILILFNVMWITNILLKIQDLLIFIFTHSKRLLKLHRNNV